MANEKLISFGLLFAIFSTCPQISYGENMTPTTDIAFTGSGAKNREFLQNGTFIYMHRKE